MRKKSSKNIEKKDYIEKRIYYAHKDYNHEHEKGIMAFVQLVFV